jgi:hypothetical protein
MAAKKRPAAPAAAAARYEQTKSRAAARDRRESAAGRDIGSISPPADAARRESCRLDFRRFCESYFPESFPLAWSDDHLRCIAKIEAAVLRGELFAFAMPRGSGKTTLCEKACIWAMVYGHRQFIVLIGADQAIAEQTLDSIKAELEHNEILAVDFPEVCHPIRMLEGINNRARGQTCEGERTNIEWNADQITLPWVTGSAAAGSCVRVAGITGRIRGLKHSRPDGRQPRPDLVLIDDPQTDESAASPAQVATREKILSGAILGLAGPGRRIAGLCTVTVIRTDDLADRLLDRVRHPAWQGERTKLVYEWPTAEELWSQYAEIRREGQRTGEGTAASAAFYADRRTEMDAGSRVAWPARMAPGDLSAIQHAWNLRIDRGEAAFQAEFQNQPTIDDMASDKLDKRSLAARVVSIARGTVPAGHNTLTAYVDVQERLLYWLVASWSSSFGGHVVSYGSFPDQGSTFFEAQTAKRTLSMAAGGVALEGAIRSGLDALMPILLGREWTREDGAKLRISRLLVDSAWGKSTTVVRNFARQTPFASIVLPSLGKGIGASSKPLEGRRNRGDQVGLNWVVGSIGEAKQRGVTVDANWWKTFTAARLKLPVGDPEAITIHAGEHDLLLEHLTSEYPVSEESKTTGRRVDVWRKGLGENHWWDCLVGAACAASISGVTPASSEAGGRVRRKVEAPAAAGGRKRIVVKRANR